MLLDHTNWAVLFIVHLLTSKQNDRIVVNLEHFKSEHTGRLAGFESKLTLIHSTKLGVFTVSNGPVYHGKDLHTVLHYIILDSILSSTENGSFTPWLNNETTCTYPEPWLSALPSSVPDRPPPPVDPTPTSNKRPEGWLDEAYTLYVGSYHHQLLGFFNVTYTPSSDRAADVDEYEYQYDQGQTQERDFKLGHSRGQLRFQSGSIGEGRLDYVDGITWMMVFDGPLAYFGRTGPYRHFPLPIIFHGLDDAKPGDHFTSIAIIPYEPRAPPLYTRLEIARSSSTKNDVVTLTALIITAFTLAIAIAGWLAVQSVWKLTYAVHGTELEVYAEQMLSI